MNADTWLQSNFLSKYHTFLFDFRRECLVETSNNSAQRSSATQSRIWSSAYFSPGKNRSPSASSLSPGLISPSEVSEPWVLSTALSLSDSLSLPSSATSSSGSSTSPGNSWHSGTGSGKARVHMMTGQSRSSSPPWRKTQRVWWVERNEFVKTDLQQQKHLRPWEQLCSWLSVLF